MQPSTSDKSIRTEVIQALTSQQAWHYAVLPYEMENRTIRMYVAEGNHSLELEEELEVLLGKRIEMKPIEASILRKELGKYYRQPGDSRQKTESIEFNGEASGDFLGNLIREAKEVGSSDVHLEPYENRCRLRFRIDGVLVERYVIQKSDYPSLVNKIKIQANLDIAEKRLPQDGRIFMVDRGKGKLDIRVSVLPTLHGEKVVMRLLGADASHIRLEKLGFDEMALENYQEGIKRPTGMVLISGPTGSGKTTTLYATLQQLNKSERNILTIEDPIEYTLEGVNQVQLKENIGLDFPGAMRSFLRQDPDIIMVGEIRDQATASMAIRASLTGHLVLSTIHTNWSWGIVARLLDMGIPAYLLADTLNTAVAQRLVRLLCPHCKEEEAFLPGLYPPRFQPPTELSSHFVKQGCEHCFYTGYQGRQAIYEVISIDRELAHHIKESNLNVLDILRTKGFKSLSDNAFSLMALGATSIEEVYPILAGG
ncbi:MAG: type II/IV secretion system protein [Saprospiraceae bacterium]|nr:type II/IV secretion system protein [Saprospiraceae bacterium]